jgi:Arc/MetJ family transcription regulator
MPTIKSARHSCQAGQRASPPSAEAQELWSTLPEVITRLQLYGFYDMVLCMKTTVEITDTLLEEVKKVAAEEHTTVRALIEEGLRRVVGERQQRTAFRLRRASFGGQGLHTDVPDGSWQQIRALAYEGRGT